jgi:hypothetical protein
MEIVPVLYCFRNYVKKKNCAYSIQMQILLNIFDQQLVESANVEPLYTKGSLYVCVYTHIYMCMCIGGLCMYP